MAAATQTMPVGPSGEMLPSQLNVNSYTRLVKEEILDPGYGSQSPSTPTTTVIPPRAGIIPPSTPITTITAIPPGAGALPPTPLPTPKLPAAAAKAKRTNTRKPGGSRAKKVKSEPVIPADPNKDALAAVNGVSQSQIQDHMPVQKKKRDRFKGTTEAEVLTRVLPDHIREDLDILIVGINPGLTAAYVQHHYAGPGNHFWKCLYLSGMIPEPMNALQDAELLNYGIGFTNIVARTTRGSADLSRKEIFEGGEILKEKMLKYLPKIALFNGKGIYEVFCGHKKFYFGLQPEPFPGCPNTCVFVNPSSSARCTQLPRAVDKVPFYNALKRVRDHIRAHGSIDGIDRSQVTFPDFKLVTAPQKVKKEVKEEPTEANAEATDNQVKNNNTSAPQGGRKPAAEKVKKPRARVKKEKTTGNSGGVSSSATGLPATSTAISLNNHISQQQLNLINTSRIPYSTAPVYSHNSVTSNMKQSQPHNIQHRLDMNIKQETLDGSHTDRPTDFAAIIQQSISLQQSVLQQQQQSFAASAMRNPNLTAASLNAGLLLPAAMSSAVKQERPDWSGYGEMPANSLSAYPPYYCYWNYLQQPPTSASMANQYSSIPAAPQIAHQQAVAAASALHTSVSVSQPNTTAPLPVTATDSLPQEASSPAMSCQSSLTQASLDSLPKADSASTVANWLQNIPNTGQEHS